MHIFKNQMHFRTVLPWKQTLCFLIKLPQESDLGFIVCNKGYQSTQVDERADNIVVNGGNRVKDPINAQIGSKCFVSHAIAKHGRHSFVSHGKHDKHIGIMSPSMLEAAATAVSHFWFPFNNL